MPARAFSPLFHAHHGVCAPAEGKPCLLPINQMLVELGHAEPMYGSQGEKDRSAKCHPSALAIHSEGCGLGCSRGPTYTFIYLGLAAEGMAHLMALPDSEHHPSLLTAPLSPAPGAFQ